MEAQEIKQVLESLLFITEQPLSIKAFIGLLSPEVPKEQIEPLLQELAQEYRTRGSALEIKEIAGGWQMATRPEFSGFVRRLYKDRLTYKLSPSAMETLTIIAYKQPITRNEIEEIRGVEVAAVLDTLVERKLIKITGRKETIGRPLLYGTTPEFLRAFGLRRLEDLPMIDDLIPPPTTEPELFTLDGEGIETNEISASGEEQEGGESEGADKEVPPTEVAPGPEEKVILSGDLPPVSTNQN